MSRLGQQMFSVRKRSGSNKCFLCESGAAATNVFCAKAKRQLRDVGHEGVITGALSLLSSIANPLKESPIRHYNQLILWYMF
jgi:hypothetical protein